MSAPKKQKKSAKPKKIQKLITKIPDQTAGEIRVILDEKPFTKKDQVIHPRVKLPEITRGKLIPDKTPSPPVDIDKDK